MLFSSMTFVFLFLPILCLLHVLMRGVSWRNGLLLAASVLFYAWGEPRYLVIMLGSILVNYGGALWIASSGSIGRRWALFVTILLNLGCLVYFKYFDFIVDNVNALFSLNLRKLDVVMPIGISFYTFQAMSYVIDVYRRETRAQRNLGKLALYITFFPQLVAGPIVKYHDIAGQIEHRDIPLDKVAQGIKRFIVGLAKKVLLANTLGAIADKIFAQPVEEFGVAVAWLGALSYSLQLYYDFSGYSDMAIGLGSLFGFTFLENFNYPYISKSITEFWRRWHISLSTWFKEYLYIPLGGNRVPPGRMYANLLLVFFVTGVWHGADWKFVVWGLWHGLFILLERVTGLRNATSGAARNALRHLYVILVFVIGWVLFRADTLAGGFRYLKNMFGLVPEHQLAYKMHYYADRIEWLALIAGLIGATPVMASCLDRLPKGALTRLVSDALLLLLFLLSAASLAASTYNPFIYFRF